MMTIMIIVIVIIIIVIIAMIVIIAIVVAVAIIIMLFFLFFATSILKWQLVKLPKQIHFWDTLASRYKQQQEQKKQ